MAESRGEARLVGALAGCRKVNLDTNALIYYLEDRPPYSNLMAAVFGLIADGQLEGVVSSIAQMELLVKPIRDNDLEAVNAIIDFVEETDNVNVFDISRAVALRAAAIRAEGLSVPDALIIATGATADCDATITNDGGWQRAIDGLTRRPTLMRHDAPPRMPRVIYLKDYVGA